MFPQTMACIGILISIAVQDRALPEIPLTREAVLPPNVYLIKARAISAKSFKINQAPVLAASFRIEHVYVGPADLKDQTFSFEQISTIMTNLPQGIPTPVAKGDMSIWWIKKEKAELVSVYGLLSKWGFDKLIFTPVLKDGSKDGEIRYQIAVAKAEVFEKIHHADDKNRLKIIDEYVQTHDSIRGAGALIALLTGNMPKKVPFSEGKPLRDQWQVEKHPKIAEYAFSLSKDETLSPRVQRQVQQLLNLNKEGWGGSPEEWKMFQRWFTGTWKEKDNLPWEASEEKFLVELFYTRPLTIPRRLELAVAGLANASRSDRFKTELLSVVKATEKAPRQLYFTEAREGFAYLLQAIRKDPGPNTRAAAAKLLTVFAPLSDDHRAVVHGLRGETLADDVRKELTKVLAEK